MNSQDTANPLFASLGVINKARPLDTTHIINWLELLSPAPVWGGIGDGITFHPRKPSHLKT